MTDRAASPVRRLLGGPDDRARPLRLLALLTVVLSLPTLVFAVLLVVDDAGTSGEEMDGFGVFFGLVLVVWVAIPLLLVGLAWRLRARPVACAVLAAVVGLLMLWVGTTGTGWFPVGGAVAVVVAVLVLVLSVAAAALGVLVAVRSLRARRGSPVG